MSSKLFRGTPEVESPALGFRPAGGPPVAIPRIRSNEPDAQARIAAAEQTAYAAGQAAGMAAASQRAHEQLTPVLTGLNAVIQELGSLRAQVRREAEAGTVELAIAIARRVLHREIATDPEAILGLVKSAAQRLNLRETHKLRVAPADFALIDGHRTRLQLPPAVEIVPDVSLIGGSAIFETSRGEMDASIHTQLDEIQRGLTDVVRRQR